MNKPLRLSEETVQYWLEKSLEELEAHLIKCNRVSIKKSLYWDYIIWRKKGSKESVIYT